MSAPNNNVKHLRVKARGAHQTTSGINETTIDHTATEVIASLSALMVQVEPWAKSWNINNKDTSD